MLTTVPSQVFDPIVPLSNQVNHDVVLDTSSDPEVRVVRVYTTLEGGVYGVGQEIPISVVFSAPVRKTRSGTRYR